MSLLMLLPWERLSPRRVGQKAPPLHSLGIRDEALRRRQQKVGLQQTWGTKRGDWAGSDLNPNFAIRLVLGGLEKFS